MNPHKIGKYQCQCESPSHRSSSRYYKHELLNELGGGGRAGRVNDYNALTLSFAPQEWRELNPR